MAKQDNLRVVINKHGKRIRMSEAALDIARKHFGIITEDMVKEKSIPVELGILRLPKKIEIIKAVPQEVKPKEVKIPDKIEIKTEEKVTVEVTEPKPKRTRRKKNETAKK